MQAWLENQLRNLKSTMEASVHSEVCNSSDLFDWEEGEDGVEVTLAHDGEGFGDGSGDTGSV